MWRSPLRKGDRVLIQGAIIRVLSDPSPLVALNAYGVRVIPICGSVKALASFGFTGLLEEALAVHRTPFTFNSVPILEINNKEVVSLENEFFSR